MPRALDGDRPDDVFEDLVSTEAALGADPDAKDFVPRVAELIEGGWEVATRAMRDSLRTEAAARAIAAVRDAELDDDVLGFGDALLAAVGKDRLDARFKRYFKQAPTRFVRIGRVAEATAVQSWVPSIEKEPEPAVAAFAEPLAKEAQASLDALSGATTATGERASTRARMWDAFVKRADAERALLHADLVRRGQERGRPKGWPERFFRTVSRSPSKAGEVPTERKPQDGGK